MKVIRKLQTISLAAVVMLTFLTACDTGKQKGFTSFDYTLQGETAVVSALAGATSSVKLAVRELANANVITSLNSAHARGVEVNLVVDADSATVAGLDVAISKKAGNLDGDMDANFAVLDGTKALFLSGHNISDTGFLVLTVRETQLVRTLEEEFGKMYDLNNFGNGDGASSKKLKTNYLTEFNAGDNSIEMYFIPQNYVFTDTSNYVFSRMDQVKGEAIVAASKVDNDGMYKRLRHYWDYGVSVSYRFGSGQDSVGIDDSYLRGLSATSVAAVPYNFNLVFVDPGKAYQTMVFTSFQWNQASGVSNSDGVCLMISGPDVEKIFNAVSGYTN